MMPVRSATSESIDSTRSANHGRSTSSSHRCDCCCLRPAGRRVIPLQTSVKVTQEINKSVSTASESHSSTFRSGCGLESSETTLVSRRNFIQLHTTMSRTEDLSRSMTTPEPLRGESAKSSTSVFALGRPVCSMEPWSPWRSTRRSTTSSIERFCVWAIARRRSSA